MATDVNIVYNIALDSTPRATDKEKGAFFGARAMTRKSKGLSRLSCSFITASKRQHPKNTSIPISPYTFELDRKNFYTSLSHFAIVLLYVGFPQPRLIRILVSFSHRYLKWNGHFLLEWMDQNPAKVGVSSASLCSRMWPINRNVDNNPSYCMMRSMLKSSIWWCQSHLAVATSRTTIVVYQKPWKNKR